MRLSRNHVDYIAFLVMKELQANSRVEVRDPDAIARIVRTRVLENLQTEAELEKQAETLLAPHKQEILRTGGDYRTMVKQGMRRLARDKGFHL